MNHQVLIRDNQRPELFENAADYDTFIRVRPDVCTKIARGPENHIQKEILMIHTRFDERECDPARLSAVLLILRRKLLLRLIGRLKIGFSLGILIFSFFAILGSGEVRAETGPVFENSQLQNNFIQKILSWHEVRRFLKVDEKQWKTYRVYSAKFDREKSRNIESEAVDKEGRRFNKLELYYKGVYTGKELGGGKIEYTFVVDLSQVTRQWKSVISLDQKSDFVFYGLDNAKVLIPQRTSTSVTNSDFKSICLANCLFDYTDNELAECVKWIKQEKSVSNFNIKDGSQDWEVLLAFYGFLLGQEKATVYENVLKTAPGFLRECVIDIIVSKPALLSQANLTDLILSKQYVKSLKRDDFAAIAGGIYSGMLEAKNQDQYIASVQAFLKALDAKIILLRNSEDSSRLREVSVNVVRWIEIIRKK